MNTVDTLSDRTWIDMLSSTGIITACGAILVVVFTAHFTAMAARRKTRIERYALVVATLTGWAEFPFRIRRRPSDDVAIRIALVEHGHRLQEQMVLDSAELAAECPWLAKRYEVARREIQNLAKPFLIEAWATEPSLSSASMNLDGWGPTDLRKIIVNWQYQLRYRFGFRRFINPARLIWQWSRRKRTTAHTQF